MTLIRCERGDHWSSVVLDCEPFEIGTYARTSGMRLGAKDGTGVAEIELVCRHRG